MSTAVLIIGTSGSGKTAALRNMSPASTLLIQALKKPLPFKTDAWGYLSQENPTGNIKVSDSTDDIIRYMQRTSRPVIVIDDWQYILTNEFMRRAAETGYQKFTEIGRNAWTLLMAANSLPDNKRVYILAHSATDEMTGNTHVKTIGRMLDEKIVVEGMFSIVMRSIVHDGRFLFSTVNSGNDTVKTPIGLFDTPMIDNDLKAVDDAICKYYDIK